MSSAAIAPSSLHPNPQFTLRPTRLLAALCSLAVASCSSPDGQTAPDAGVLTTESELRDGMRALWVDHVTWTRTYLISAIADLPDQEAAAERLLQNQADIGDAIKPFYGDDAGDALTGLLREHITIAAEIVVAAKAGDPAAFEDARTRWLANADEIAGFLAGANPDWPAADLKTMMRAHLEQTLAEATARLGGDWAADTAAYDEIVDHILHMADTLSAGIASQFRDQVAPGLPMSARDETLHLAMRDLWADHVTWTRVYLIAAIANLPDESAAAERLLQNQADIGDAIKPFYGDGAGGALTALLREHITIAAELVAAARAGDPAAFEDARTRWFANADDISELLAGANPNWPVADLKAMMRGHLEQTLAEATARLDGDWAADISAYEEIVDHILHMADVLSEGIARQFPAHHHGT